MHFSAFCRVFTSSSHVSKTSYRGSVTDFLKGLKSVEASWPVSTDYGTVNMNAQLTLIITKLSGQEADFVISSISLKVGKMSCLCIAVRTRKNFKYGVFVETIVYCTIHVSSSSLMTPLSPRCSNNYCLLFIFLPYDV